MADQKKKTDAESLAQAEEKAAAEARKARNYLVNKEILVKMTKKKAEKLRKARRFVVNREVLEVNGRTGTGAQIIDLSMNGARLRLPFCPPFMSQITLKFTLQTDTKVLSVVGRVIWSRHALTKGWHEVGVQFYQNYWELDQLLRLEYR